MGHRQRTAAIAIGTPYSSDVSLSSPLEDRADRKTRSQRQTRREASLGHSPRNDRGSGKVGILPKSPPRQDAQCPIIRYPIAQSRIAQSPRLPIQPARQGRPIGIACLLIINSLIASIGNSPATTAAGRKYLYQNVLEPIAAIRGSVTAQRIKTSNMLSQANILHDEATELCIAAPTRVSRESLFSEPT